MAEHFEEGEHGYAIIVCILNDLDKKDIDINILKYKFLKCLKCNFLPFTIIQLKTTQIHVPKVTEKSIVFSRFSSW